MPQLQCVGRPFCPSGDRRQPKASPGMRTDCGMVLFTNDDMRKLLASSLKAATLEQSGWRDSGQGPGSTEGNYINWLTFSDNAKSVVEDVTRIRNHPLVPNDIPIYGYIYDVKSGKLIEVPEATTAGKAS